MSHESRGVPRLRTLLVSAAVVFVSCVAAASDDASSSQACGTQRASATLDDPRLDNPSKLDYLVLASMADSPRPLAMASYARSTSAKPNGASSGGSAPVVLR
jgi:hypothetical protein